jgi:uncharacterized membrane protein (UPF0127 family)
MRFYFNLGKRKLNVQVNKVGLLMSGFGLTFKTKNTKNLLFVFRKPSKIALTSVFVFFPFVAVWLDENKKVIETRTIKPFSMSINPKHNSKYLIELPLNSKNSKLIEKIINHVGD